MGKVIANFMTHAHQLFLFPPPCGGSELEIILNQQAAMSILPCPYSTYKDVSVWVYHEESGVTIHIMSLT